MTNKNLVFIILITFIFLFCSRKEDTNKQTGRIISIDKMAEIMADMHIAEAASTLNEKYQDSIEQSYINYYYWIFEQYQTDKETFRESLNYYLSKPIEFQKVYEKVTEKLHTKKGEKY
jgi:lauroyl/myristoyl acyltransferase